MDCRFMLRNRFQYCSGDPYHLCALLATQHTGIDMQGFPDGSAIQSGPVQLLSLQGYIAAAAARLGR